MPADQIIDGVLQGLSAVIFDDSAKVLMLLRAAKDENFKTGWEFVKGGVQIGETRLEAAFREVREETGLDNVELVAELPRVYVADVRYRHKEYHSVEKSTIVFHYRGGDIRLDGKEHATHRWMDVSEAQEVCWVEFGREIIGEAYEAFENWRAHIKVE